MQKSYWEGLWDYLNMIKTKTVMMFGVKYEG